MPQDPKDQGKKPPFPQEEQAHPGSEREMSPRPDYGEETYRGLGRLKGRIAVVTGADSGIGRAVALAFAREGADVVISYLNEHEDANETKSVVESAGRRALLVAGDLAEEQHCRRVVDEAVRAFGRIHVLVNNAAFQGKSVEKFEEIDAARIDRTFRVNIEAMFHLIRYALPHFEKGGAIVNSASVQAYHPNASILDYAGPRPRGGRDNLAGTRLPAVSDLRLDFEPDGGVLEVTLDRPPANAIDLATSRAMGEVFAAFRDSRDLRVAVLRTAGARFFSAGWDLKAAAGVDEIDPVKKLGFFFKHLDQDGGG